MIEITDTQNTIYLNIDVAKNLNNHYAAIMLYELVQRYNYHVSKKEVMDGGWFFYTREMAEERLGIARKQQENAIQILIEKNLIQNKNKGLPKRRTFKINVQEFKQFEKECKKLNRRDEKYHTVGTKRTIQLVQKVPTEFPGPPYIEDNIYIYNNSSIHVTRAQEANAKAATSSPPHTSNFSCSSSKKDFDPALPKASPSKKPSVPQKAERAPLVFSSNEEHEKLVAKHGAELTQEAYIFLSEWKSSSDNIYSVKNQRSDYYRILRWVVQAVKEKKIKEKELKVREERLQNPNKRFETARQKIDREQLEKYNKIHGSFNDSANVLDFRNCK